MGTFTGTIIWYHLLVNTRQLIANFFESESRDKVYIYVILSQGSGERKLHKFCDKAVILRQTR